MTADFVRHLLATVQLHRARTALALLGIVWGTASVMLLVPWGAGIQHSLVEQASSGGRRMMAFFPGRSSSGVGANRGGREIRLKRADAHLLAEQLPELEAVSAGTLAWSVYVRSGTNYRRAATVSIEPPAAEIMELRAAAGRMIDDQDLLQRRRVVVLGAELKDRLFGRREAVGEPLEVNGIRFTVVGVLAKKGDQISSLGPPDDYKMLVPLTTYQTLIAGNDDIHFIAVTPKDTERHVALTTKVRKVLGAKHGFTADDTDALSVFDVVNFIDLFRNLTGALRLFNSVVAVVTLAIGAIGVMNIMLLAVTERRREIGLRRAVGATRLDILLQFLGEGMVMTGVGGTIGIVLGWLLTGVLPVGVGVGLVRSFVSWRTVAFSAGLLGCVGVLAGLWPALRAARLDPVQALRFE